MAEEKEIVIKDVRTMSAEQLKAEIKELAEKNRLKDDA